MKKLKAFTILELVVVMILSGIVVGIAYTSYRMVNGQFQSSREANKKVSDVMMLRHLLNEDLSKPAELLRTGSGWVVKDNKKIISEYKAEENALVRIQQEVADTFYFEAMSYELLLLNKPTSELADKITLNIRTFGEERQLIFNKLYGADVLMEATTENGN